MKSNAKKWYQYLERISLPALVYGREDAPVDPEGHGCGQEGQASVARHGEEGDVAAGDQGCQDGAEDDGRVPGVRPLDQLGGAAAAVGAKEHLGAGNIQEFIFCASIFVTMIVHKYK